MEHQGIVVNGEVLTGTDWCRRDDDAWWDPDSKQMHPKWRGKGAMALDKFQLKKRVGPLNIIVGHWTAGEAGTANYLDDGKRVVSVLKRRSSRKKPGNRLKASAPFIIGACSLEDEYAHCWQTMDLGTWAGTHVGWGKINRRSTAAEVVSAGRDGHANLRDREETEVFLVGKHREVLKFYPGQLRTWVRLANALSGKCLPGNIEIPRQVPVERLRDGSVRIMGRRFTRRELHKWKGGMEHYCMSGTTKLDAGTLLLQALFEAGWEGIVF